MGRSTTHKTQNPSGKFFKWNAKFGKITYYNGEKEVDVPFSEKDPFKFLIIERGAQVTGGIKRNGVFVGFWSNFVLNTVNQPLVVRSKEGVEAEGLYKDIKNTRGVKFAASLYIGTPGESGLELNHILFSGSALNAWIDASKKKDIFKGAFAITGAVKDDSGDVTFHAPVFKYYPEVSEKADFEAKALDEQLQEFLKSYFNTVPEEVVHEEVTVNENFVTAAAGAISSSINGTQVQDPTADAPFDPSDDDMPDDLPF